MAETNTLTNDTTSVIITLSEGISCLHSEIRRLREILTSSIESKIKHEGDQEWLTLDDLKEYIPGNPSDSTLRRWIKQEGLPAQKIKRKLVFQKSQVDEWLKNRTVVSNAEIERQVKESMLLLEKNKKPRWRQEKSAS